jgi:hypothetical protein
VLLGGLLLGVTLGLFVMCAALRTTHRT